MNNILTNAVAALSLFACASIAHAAPGDTLSDCVDLSGDRKATRFGSQYLILKDGEEHYRVGFHGSCEALAMSPSVKISTDGEINRLCPSGSSVATKRDTCKVQSVVEIRPDEFERYARTAKR